MQALRGGAGGTEGAAIELYDLLRDGSGTATLIHDADPSVLQRSWALLERLGLVETDDVERRCAAVAPELAVGRLLELCRSVLLTREQDIANAVWGTSSSAPRRNLSEHPEVELVAGRRTIALRLAETYRTPAASRVALHTDSVPVRTVDSGALCELAGRGVRMRTVYKCRSELSQAQRLYLDGLSRLGVSLRLDHRPPIDLILIDQRTVVLPVYPAHPGQALAVLRSRVWAHVAELIAKDCWQTAVPYRSGRGPVPLHLAANPR